MLNRKRHNQKGFTLVEVLVTVLVLAVGLLGLAGLQLAGMKSNRSAYLRSQAVIATYDLLDRMRAEPSSFSGKKHEFDEEAESVVAFDDWEAFFGSLDLPPPVDVDTNGRAYADCSGSNACGSDNCAVAVRWDDSRGERAVDPAAETQRAESLELRICTRLPI